MGKDQNGSANDTEARLADRRDLLNRWMLRLPLNERQSRWAEYLVRLSRLEGAAKREKKKPAAQSASGPITSSAATQIILERKASR